MKANRLALVAMCGVLAALALVAGLKPTVSADEDAAFLEKNPKGEIETVATFEDLMHGMVDNHKKVQQALLKKEFGTVESPARLAAEISNLAVLHGKPDQFKEYASGMRDAWMDLAAAAGAEDFDKARTAFGQANQFCADCHDTYRVKLEEHEEEGDHDDHEGHAH